MTIETKTGYRQNDEIAVDRKTTNRSEVKIVASIKNQWG